MIHIFDIFPDFRFHYVHHESREPEGQFALDIAVVEAAQLVGIRLVLIGEFYFC